MEDESNLLHIFILKMISQTLDSDTDAFTILELAMALVDLRKPTVPYRSAIIVRYPSSQVKVLNTGINRIADGARRPA